MPDEGALSGIKVVDMSRMLPGPFCSMILADHGARVIVVEDRRFEVDNLYIETINRNKEHMTLNLKSERGKEIFFRLIKDADVFIEGFRPGVVHRLGIDYDALSAVNPGIVYCAISGYGQTGPFRDRAGHDINYLAIAGVLDQIGEAGGAPVTPGVQLADIAGGGMTAAYGILLALFSRQRTGRGQYVDISMTDASTALLALVHHMSRTDGSAPRRGDSFLSHRYACYNVYETKDGKYLSIGAVENRFWRRLCEHLGVARFAGLQYDDARRHEIQQFMRDRFKEKTLSEWKSELASVDTCWAEVNDLDTVLEAPLFKDRGMVPTVADREGRPVTMLGVPVKLSQTPGSIRTAPVGFGQSTAAILAELGYSSRQIAALSAEEVV